MVAFCSGWLSNVSCMIVTKKWLLWIIKFRTVGVCEAFVARGAWPSWNVQQLFYCTMSRAVLAEAVLSNVLYYIEHTKYIRQGSAIACRNFLLSVCFHKQCFPKKNYTQLENLQAYTGTHSLATYLRNSHWEMFATNLLLRDRLLTIGEIAWYVCLFVVVLLYDIFITGPHLCGNSTFDAKHDCCTGRYYCLERSKQSLEWQLDT